MAATASLPAVRWRSSRCSAGVAAVVPVLFRGCLGRESSGTGVVCVRPAMDQSFAEIADPTRGRWADDGAHGGARSGNRSVVGGVGALNFPPPAGGGQGGGSEFPSPSGGGRWGGRSREGCYVTVEAAGDLSMGRSGMKACPKGCMTADVLALSAMRRSKEAHGRPASTPAGLRKEGD